jgi:hypothetical protein
MTAAHRGGHARLVVDAAAKPYCRLAVYAHAVPRLIQLFHSGGQVGQWQPCAGHCGTIPCGHRQQCVLQVKHTVFLSVCVCWAAIAMNRQQGDKDYTGGMLAAWPWPPPTHTPHAGQAAHMHQHLHMPTAWLAWRAVSMTHSSAFVRCPASAIGAMDLGLGRGMAGKGSEASLASQLKASSSRWPATAACQSPPTLVIVGHWLASGARGMDVPGVDIDVDSCHLVQPDRHCFEVGESLRPCAWIKHRLASSSCSTAQKPVHCAW